MRIAMFTDSYRPQINGVVTSIDIFAEELRKRNHDVFIFAPQAPKSKKEHYVYRTKSLAFSGYKEYRVALPFKLLATFPIEKLKPDVIHIHSPFSMGVTGLAIAKHYKIPTIGSFHTMLPEYMHYVIKSEKLQRSKLVKKMFRKSAWSYLRWFYTKCDYVIAPTENIKNTLEKQGIDKEIFVVPTGVRMKHTKKLKSTRKDYGLDKKDKIILHVGRITVEKNIDFIIDSLRHILNNHDNYKLVITSDGPHKEKLIEKVRSLHLENNVIFTGYLSEGKLNEIYQLSDVFVMASKTETQGVVILEAAVNGLPVVALDSPVTRDIINQGGLGVVSKGKDFSKNIEKILKNKKSLKMSKSIESYDIKKCAKKLVDVYSEAKKSKISE